MNLQTAQYTWLDKGLEHAQCIHPWWSRATMPMIFGIVKYYPKLVLIGAATGGVTVRT